MKPGQGWEILLLVALAIVLELLCGRRRRKGLPVIPLYLLPVLTGLAVIVGWALADRALAVLLFLMHWMPG